MAIEKLFSSTVCLKRVGLAQRIHPGIGVSGGRILREDGILHDKIFVLPDETSPRLLTLTLHPSDEDKRIRGHQLWLQGGFSRRTHSEPYVKFRKSEYNRRWCSLVRAEAVWAVVGMQRWS